MNDYGIVEESLEVDAPAGMVFQRLMRFEEFPQFMEGVMEVRPLDQNTLFWRGKSAGKIREWRSEISVVIPGERLAWRTTSEGAHSSRVVSIASNPEGKTRVTFKMLLDPSEPQEEASGVEPIAQRLAGDLKRFKALMESTSAR